MKIQGEEYDRRNYDFGDSVGEGAFLQACKSKLESTNPCGEKEESFSKVVMWPSHTSTHSNKNK